ncbi:transcriptional regulator [Halobacillus andaensis]|uniref:Transcriptional regulator n=1 Tax=Halobacillus andaensis TaxID=1176239 RepID=A0A917EZG1_HALAA|nr:LacI family DNA-binding transcriptional regulator [Halobacillus andaensis]MBP2005111.1 LacI family transcriptional regulator [Halobacillus andaensis]GGF28941.1 transcriptional regulator [Halobacillus andaensis]
MTSSKDVAKRAGVSQSTVSRVLNTPEKVDRIKYEKVVEAMKELNYRPNSIARSLVKKQTKSIALISGPLHNPFFVETTTSIVNYSKKRGYNVNVHFENFGDNMSVYQDVLEHEVDGIILSSILYDDPIFPELQKQNIPFIMFNRKHREPGNYVEMDNVQAGRIATEHLMNLNHTNIVCVGGPSSMTTFQGRYEGFRQVMEENGIEVSDHNARMTDTSEEAIREVIREILAEKDRPTAIFAATDSIAIFILDYLIQKGYSVPEDMSLIGVDNIALSSHHSFQLTTVGMMEKENLGQLAIEHLIEHIECPDSESVQETYPVQLYRRSTTRDI